MPKLPMERTAARERVQTVFANGKEGDFISHVRMSSILEMPSGGADTQGYSICRSALISVEQDRGLCWRYTREGYKCLTDSEKVTDLSDRVRGIRKKSLRNLSVANTVDYSNLSKEEQARAVASHNVSAAAAIITSGATVKKLIAGQPVQTLPSSEDVLRLCANRYEDKDE